MLDGKLLEGKPPKALRESRIYHITGSGEYERMLRTGFTKQENALVDSLSYFMLRIMHVDGVP